MSINPSACCTAHVFSQLMLKHPRPTEGYILYVSHRGIVLPFLRHVKAVIHQKYNFKSMRQMHFCKSILKLTHPV